MCRKNQVFKRTENPRNRINEKNNMLGFVSLVGNTSNGSDCVVNFFYTPSIMTHAYNNEKYRIIIILLYIISTH